MRTVQKLALAATLIMTVLAASLSSQNAAQGGKLAVAKGLRCSFPLSSVAGWKKDGQPEAALKPGAFTLRFDSIDTDEGTAKLRNGTMESEIIARAAPGYLHLMQSFRSGPMYITTVFDQPAGGGKLKAVHSRHEYLEPPLAGATSSPEQYYGECEITE